MLLLLISAIGFDIGSPKSPSIKKKGSQKKNPLVVCFGELLIDFVPTVSGVSLADAPGFKKAPGGAPANVAVGIAKLGGSSAFIGKVHTLSPALCIQTNIYSLHLTR